MNDATQEIREEMLSVLNQQRQSYINEGHVSLETRKIGRAHV